MEGEQPDTELMKVHILCDDVPDILVLPTNQARVKWVFLTAIGISKDEVFAAYKTGVCLFNSILADILMSNVCCI